MKSLKTFALALLLILGFGFHSGTARAQDSVSFDFFYDKLQPYGEWLQVGDYGYCWHPTGVDENWRPYSDGYWAYTDDGWTWVSYEEHGWITYHYGRWVNVEDTGWCWVPDTEWAPAWVSWRSSDDCVGWAPLPPEAAFTADVGISVWADNTYGIGPESYNFCYARDFGAPGLLPVIIDRRKNVTFINQTVNITNITYNNSRVYNGGPSFQALSRRSARPIQTLRILHQTGAAAFAGRGNPMARVQGNQLFVASPTVVKPEGGFKPPTVARVIATPKINKGWTGITDPKISQELHAKLAKDAKGLTPETAHAKPVSAAALKPIPTKIVGPAAAGVGDTHRGSVSPTPGSGRKGKGKPVATPAEVGTTPAPVAPSPTATKPFKGKKGKPAFTPGEALTTPPPGEAAPTVAKPFKAKKTPAGEGFQPGAPERTPASELKPFVPKPTAAPQFDREIRHEATPRPTVAISRPKPEFEQERPRPTPEVLKRKPVVEPQRINPQQQIQSKPVPKKEKGKPTPTP